MQGAGTRIEDGEISYMLLSGIAFFPGCSIEQKASREVLEMRQNVLEMLKKHACRARSMQDVICVRTASDTRSSEELHDSFCDTIPFFLTPRRRCCGISVTTMPGRPSRAVFNWNAVWLCSGTSHQWATTNSGRMTVRVSSGYKDTHGVNVG